MKAKMLYTFTVLLHTKINLIPRLDQFNSTGTERAIVLAIHFAGQKKAGAAAKGDRISQESGNRAQPPFNESVVALWEAQGGFAKTTMDQQGRRGQCHRGQARHADIGCLRHQKKAKHGKEALTTPQSKSTLTSRSAFEPAPKAKKAAVD
jgi:hypothetical protein